MVGRDPADDGSDPLTARLKRETEEHHRAVERTDFLRRLATGRMGRPAYCRYLRSLLPVYRALETALEHAAGAGGEGRDPVLSPLWEPALARTGPLSVDLEALHGPGWRRELDPVPAARRYARRLERLAREAPHRLAAHCYLRYMGDLSGGRMLRSVVARSMDLGPEGEDGTGEGREDGEVPPGIAFYGFADLGRDPDAFRDAYRARFDRLELTEVEEEEMVEEAVRGYEIHGEIFRELAEASPA
jgi:heme oxygenase